MTKVSPGDWENARDRRRAQITAMVALSMVVVLYYDRNCSTSAAYNARFRLKNAFIRSAHSASSTPPTTIVLGCRSFEPILR